jgi:hypothetical protein
MAALAILVSLGLPSSLLACSCQGLDAPSAFRRSPAVFAGTLVSQKRVNPDAIELTFRANLYWKGGGASRVRLRTGFRSNCDTAFRTGDDYLVYTRVSGADPKVQWTGGLCDRTRPLAYAGADLAALGAGHSPDAPPMSARDWLIVALVLIALIGFVVDVRHIRKWSKLGR